MDRFVLLYFLLKLLVLPNVKVHQKLFKSLFFKELKIPGRVLQGVGWGSEEDSALVGGGSK